MFSLPLWAVFTVVFTIAGCIEPIEGVREEVIDGRFERWPDADEGDAWRIDGEADLSAEHGHLAITATGDAHSGAISRIPVVPGREYALSLRHRGAPGRAELILDDLRSVQRLDLPAATVWRTVSIETVPRRDGISLRLLDRPGDGESLEVDSVSLHRGSYGDTRYEPPIRILVVTHAETDINSPERYWERRDALSMLVDRVEEHDLRLTAMISGPFAEWAIIESDVAFYSDLQQRGHEFGTYVFPQYWVEPLNWDLGPIFDEGMADREWADHRSWVEQLVPAAENRVVCAYAPMALMPQLMSDHGYELDLASVAVTSEDGSSRESVAWSYIGHHPHHPFRPADTSVEGQELAGDPGSPYVTVTHAAQVGRQEAHGCPGTLEDYQRQFGLLLDRWTAHQRTLADEGDDRIWTFGVLNNLSHVATFDEDFTALLQFLQAEGLEATSAEGNPVATSATASDLLDEYLLWEAGHPEDPGFSFTLPP